MVNGDLKSFRLKGPLLAQHVNFSETQFLALSPPMPSAAPRTPRVRKDEPLPESDESGRVEPVENNVVIVYPAQRFLAARNPFKLPYPQRTPSWQIGCQSRRSPCAPFVLTTSVLPELTVATPTERPRHRMALHLLTAALHAAVTNGVNGTASPAPPQNCHRPTGDNSRSPTVVTADNGTGTTVVTRDNGPPA